MAFAVIHSAVNGNDAFVSPEQRRNFSLKIFQRVSMFGKDYQLFSFAAAFGKEFGRLQKFRQLLPLSILAAEENFFRRVGELPQSFNFSAELCCSQ